ncbi:MAG: GAF domain-containing protein, partial [Candidatus Kapabacteria bacterium]|nr:GAF domain-containing protein [Candidatus Kapabacteria bacterium]
MVEELKRLLRLLSPVDWLAAGVAVLGLLIALLLDDAAVRLIGVSIALLGAVAFFLLISQRLSEEIPYHAALRSQAHQLRKTVQQESGSTRLIFDDFAATFSDPDAIPSTPTEHASSTPLGEEFTEDISSVRIVGRRSRNAVSPTAPSPVSQTTLANAPERPPARVRPISLPDFMLTPVSLPRDEPRYVLRTLLERVLSLVQVITPTRTAALFWLDTERQLLVLEAWQSEIAELFRSEQQKFPLGQDIISQIAVSGRAEIVTEIQPNAELELLPYYRQPTGTNSFVGVPILLQNRSVGVLCLDSEQPQAYTATTVSLLGHIVLLIGGLLQSYIQQYELLQKTRAWKHACNLWKLAAEPEEAFVQSVLALFSSLLSASVLLLCLYTQRLRGWRVADMNAPEPWQSLRQTLCTLEQTLLGDAIYTGEIRQWSEGTYRYRLHPNEPPLAASTFTYVIPLCSPTHAYGALYCETPEPLAPQELELVETLSRWVGIITEHRYWNEQLRGGLWFHSNQGIWSEDGFRYRVSEELERIRTLHTHAVLCAMQVDRYGTLSGLTLARMRELLTVHVLPLLRSHLRSCDIVGYLAEDIIGIVLPSMEMPHAQLWAEGVR